MLLCFRRSRGTLMSGLQQAKPGLQTYPSDLDVLCKRGLHDQVVLKTDFESQKLPKVSPYYTLHRQAAT